MSDSTLIHADAGEDEVYAVLDRVLVAAGQPGLTTLRPGERRLISWAGGRLEVRTVPSAATGAQGVDDDGDGAGA